MIGAAGNRAGCRDDVSEKGWVIARTPAPWQTPGSALESGCVL